MAAIGQRFKDNVTSQYLRRQDMLNARMFGLDQQDYAGYDRMAGSWMNLMGSGLNAAAGAIGQQYGSMYNQGGKNGMSGWEIERIPAGKGKYATNYNRL